jgi:nuclear GTP-binding protein
MCDMAKDKRLLAGQSRRIWEELYKVFIIIKVIDASDVILQIIDARDPMGTRCKHLEEHIKKNCPQKHLVLVLNKVDLIPPSVTVFLKFRKNGLKFYKKSSQQLLIELV